ncbi:MAG: hypothetical protein LBG11_00740 [Bifidobacteriaceae bacterium]|nr:hypothetical protein [Bifidobacteriaceae bacterium]
MPKSHRTAAGRCFLWRRVLAATCLATLIGASTACSEEPSAAEQAAASDMENLAAALTTLGPRAASCSSAPPAGLSAEGLALLAAHAPAWSSAVHAANPDLGANGSADAVAASNCEPAELRRGLARVRALSVRLAGSSGDAVLVSLTRASAVDEVILFDTPVREDLPTIEDLASLDAAQLADLALAEDQAGFVGEFLAANVPDADLQEQLSAAAVLHRDRGQALATLAAGDDPRRAAYQQGERPADRQGAADRWGQVELALASHYAALPMSSGADRMVTWQLLEAASWGAPLPALPFLD